MGREEKEGEPEMPTGYVGKNDPTFVGSKFGGLGILYAIVPTALFGLAFYLC